MVRFWVLVLGSRYMVLGSGWVHGVRFERLEQLGRISTLGVVRKRSHHSKPPAHPAFRNVFGNYFKPPPQGKLFLLKKTHPWGVGQDVNLCRMFNCG